MPSSSMLSRLARTRCSLVLLVAAALLLPGHTALAQATPGAPGATVPSEVRAALERAELPREALAVWVQEVGTPVAETRPRLSWQPDASINPASLTKLLTTYAALDLLGPAWTWSTPVWLQGPVNDGVLDGNLVIKGSGDPKLVLERLWLMFRKVRQLGAFERAAHLGRQRGAGRSLRERGVLRHQQYAGHEQHQRAAGAGRARVHAR